MNVCLVANPLATTGLAYAQERTPQALWLRRFELTVLARVSAEMKLAPRTVRFTELSRASAGGKSLACKDLAIQRTFRSPKTGTNLSRNCGDLVNTNVARVVNQWVVFPQTLAK